jgi:CO/xanthine dehydrogenase Mo-binding subunit
MPFLAHATMEPVSCTVHVRKDGCEVWVGSQVLARAQATAVEVTGLPLEKIEMYNQLLGGGFGRRLEVDFITQAVRIAKQVDGPVKVVWTREEDIQHDIIVPTIMTGWLPALTKTGCRLPGVTEAPVPRSMRDGTHRHLRMDSILTCWRGRRTRRRRMRFPICWWNMYVKNRPAFR